MAHMIVRATNQRTQISLTITFFQSGSSNALTNLNVINFRLRFNHLRADLFYPNYRLCKKSQQPTQGAHCIYKCNVIKFLGKLHQMIEYKARSHKKTDHVNERDRLHSKKASSLTMSRKMLSFVEYIHHRIWDDGFLLLLFYQMQSILSRPLKLCRKICQIIVHLDENLVIVVIRMNTFLFHSGQFCGQNERSENHATQRRKYPKT